jgi:hypothetical protein
MSLEASVVGHIGVGLNRAMARDVDERLRAAGVGIAGSGAREAGRISVRPGGRDRPLAA